MTLSTFNLWLTARGGAEWSSICLAYHVQGPVLKVAQMMVVVVLFQILDSSISLGGVGTQSPEDAALLPET